MTVFNPARIWKLYGTLVQKGDELPEYGIQHRMARILEMPASLDLVSLDLLKDVVGEPTATQVSAAVSSDRRPGVDVATFLERHAIPHHTKTRGDRTDYVLDQCPFNPDHGGHGEVLVMQNGNGSVAFHCAHNSCAEKKWLDFSEHFEPTPDLGEIVTPMEDQIDDLADDAMVDDDAVPGDTSDPPALDGAADADADASVRTDSEKIVFRSIDDVRKIAADQKEDWLITNWIEFGSLAMLAGEPFGGKSCIVAELTAAIKKWTTFGPYPVGDCPILLIDLENRERITVKRLERAVEGDWGCLTDWAWAQLPESVLPLNPQKIERMIVHFKSRTLRRKPLVIIDTFRSAFNESEMDVDEIKKVLYPLQRVAQRQEAAILVLHHRPKSGAKYSGQTAIPGALDFLWVWEVDRERRTGTLELYGTRGDVQPSLHFRYDEATGRNIWVEEDSAEDQVERLTRSVLSAGPLSQTELVRRVQNAWYGTPPGVNRLRTLIDALVGSLIIKTVTARGKHEYGVLGGNVA